MKVHQRRSCLAGNETAPIKSLLRDNADLTLQYDR